MLLAAILQLLTLYISYVVPGRDQGESNGTTFTKPIKTFKLKKQHINTHTKIVP